jgi:glycosyltransferase involved in cell wall biosynthesis
MRVAVVVPSLILGGAEASVAKTVSIISQAVDRLDVIVLAGVESVVLAQLPPQVLVHVLNSRSSANPLVWMRVRRILRRLKSDVVIGWSMYANFVSVIASQGLPIRRLIVSERIYIPEMFAQSDVRAWLRNVVLMLIRVLYRKADVVTANSRASMRFLRHFVGKGPSFLELPNLIDTDLVNDYARLPPKMLSRPRIKPKILAIGRLAHQKGFDLLFEALAVIRRTHPWTIVLVGDGPEAERLHRLAERLGIEAAVQWIGAVANPFPYYHWADLVVLPSRFEGFPNVALEAMACERTVICADCKSGPRELTAAGTYGVLVPVNTVQPLADAIIQWGIDQRAREALGRAAKQHVTRSYDIARQRKHYLETLCAI